MAKRKKNTDPSKSINMLTIEGFKGFQKEARVPLRPLTIIMGENNSGKSAILKAIASLGQTKIHKRATGDSNDWVASGPWFDLGSERSFINAKNSEQSFKIGLSSEDSDLLLKYKVNEEDRFACDLEKVFLRVGDEEFIGEKLSKLTKEHGKLGEVFENNRRYRSFDLFRRSRGSLESNDYLFRSKSVSIDYIVEVIESIKEFWTYLGDDNQTDYYQRRSALIDLYKKFNKDIEIPETPEEMSELISNDSSNSAYQYLYEPLSVMAFTGDAVVVDFSINSEVPFGGSASVDIFTSAMSMRSRHFPLGMILLGDKFPDLFDGRIRTERHRNRFRGIYNSQYWNNVRRLLDSEYLGAFRLEPKRVYDIRNRSEPYYKTMQILCLSDEKAVRKINKSLSELVNVKIYPKPLRSESSVENQATQYFEVTVGKNKNANLHLSDVGYGISQLLPVLSHLNSNNTLILEEAESNLHPKAQSKLMEIIVDNLNTEDSGPQIIMESHSEHFLLRIQQLISDGKFDDDQVALIFVRKDPKHGTIVHHAETYQGDFIEELPESFEFYGNYNPTGSMI